MQALIRMTRAAPLFAATSLAGLGIGALAITRLMLPHSGPLGDRMGELTCLQMAFTSERASSLIASFSAEAQAAMLALLVPGDVTFAWSYGLILVGLLGLLARRLDGTWLRMGAVAMWFPLAASVLDCIEDMFLFRIVSFMIAENSAAATLPATLPLFASTAASLKYIFLCVLTPLYATGGIIQGLRSDRSVSALIIYALLLFAIISIVARPLQQIPACF
jgi:hypothetical protein